MKIDAISTSPARDELPSHGPTAQRAPGVGSQARWVRLPRSGVRARFPRSDAGQPVLLLHDGFARGSSWDGVVEALGAGYDCRAPDLPGLGPGALAPGFDYTPCRVDAFLDDLLDGWEGRARPIVVVHGLGGAVGLPWAARRAERIGGLVITNTVASASSHWSAASRLWGRRDLTGRAVASLGLKLLVAREAALFVELATRQWPELSAVAVHRLARDLADGAIDPGAMRSLFRQVIRPEYYAGHARLIDALTRRVATWVLWGVGDPEVPMQNAYGFVSAQVRMLWGAGHWVPLTRPREVAGAVSDLGQRAPSG